MISETISFQHATAAEVFENWRNLQLDANVVPGALGGNVRRLSATLGVAPEIATVVCCAYVGAIAGSVWSVCTPHGNALPVSFNVVLVTDSPFHLQGGVRALFEPLMTNIQERIRTSRFEDPVALVETRNQLRTRLFCAMDASDGITKPANSPMPVFGGRDAQARIQKFNDAFQQRDATVREQLLADLASVEFNLRPDVIAEALDSSAMLNPEQLSFDGCVWQLALAGEPFKILASAQAEILAQFSSLLHASWFGWTVARSLQERTPQTLLANLWMADPEVASKALKAEWAARAGLHDTFAFVDVDMMGRTDPITDPSVPEWKHTLHFLWQYRVYGAPRKLRLSKDGASHYLAFVDEVNRMHSSLRPEIKAFALHWPDLAAKLALLMHLGGHDTEPWKSPSAKKENEAKARTPVPPPEEICEETVRVALVLTKIIVARHISLMERQVATDTAEGVDPDIEKMVRKLRLCQPATKRDLYRKYDKQRSEILEPILARALAKGLIQVVEGRMLVVTDASVSETHQRQCVSSGSERKSDEGASETARTQAAVI